MHKTHAGLAAALALALASAVPAASGPLSASPGVSAPRLARIGEFVERQMATGEMPGAVTLVARNGKVVHLQAQGYADFASKKPMQKDSLMRLASMTKPVVATAVMLLVEDGKVRLDDPVSRFIPAFKDVKVAVPRTVPAGSPPGTPAYYTVPVERPLTVLDLLTHTGGLVSGAISTAAAAPVMDRRRAEGVKALEDLAAVPLEFQPGTRWQYSGLAGFELLARIVEIASTQRFGDFMQQRICGPLGMKDTTFWPTDAQRSRMATLYVMGERGMAPHPDPDRLNTPVLDSGGGGLITSIESYARFAMMLANGGELDGVRILSPASVRIMGSRVIPETMQGRQPGEGYGLGVRSITDPAARHTLLGQGSFGWSGSYGTHFWVDPARKLVAILFVQTPGQPRTADFETAVMQAVLD
ncbi:MAG: hypothetical protein RLZZ393_1288 [Pseudomonadota bacterium]|jgi:CubicO group peptidase (beta-lactamase class C family)